MTPTTPTIPTVSETTQLAIRKSSAANSTKAIGLASNLSIASSDDYIDADVVLLKLRTARQNVEAMIEDQIGCIIKPIRDGLDRLYEIRRKLTSDLLSPIETAEKSVKAKMADWQRKERDRVAEENKQKQILQAQLDRDARAKDLAAANAKSSADRTRLENEAAQRREQAANVRAVPVEAAVKVAGSSARFSKRAEVEDMTALIAAVVAGTVPEIVLAVNQEVLDAYYKQDAGLTSTWPGVKIVEDAVIAGKRGKV